MTALDLIVSAMQTIGVLAQGETPNADESAAVLARLNDLIDTWNTERLYIFTVQSALYALQAAKASYTIGTPGTTDFNATRPVLIESANVVLATSLLREPLDLLNSVQWAAIPEKTIQGLRPLKLYPDMQFPNATLYFWPVPSLAAGGASQVELFTWQALTSFALLTTAVSLPPGYQKALRYNLAVDISGEFGVQPDELTAAIAVDAKSAIQKMNAQILPGPVGEVTRGEHPERGIPQPAPAAPQ